MLQDAHIALSCNKPRGSNKTSDCRGGCQNKLIKESQETPIFKPTYLNLTKIVFFYPELKSGVLLPPLACQVDPDCLTEP